MPRRLPVLLSLLLAASVAAHAQAAKVPVDSFQIIHTYPHDPNAFTQGLIFVDGHLYESTGENGRSSLRMVDLESGRVLQEYHLPDIYFGEGLTDWQSNLLQLTWKDGKGFIYDRFSFSARGTFLYEGEGWGLTHDATGLILSDVSPYLRVIDPKTFRVVRRLKVVDENRKPVENLNELEFVKGEIYANIWHSNRIARISPETGKVLRWIDLTGILDARELTDREAVLNGIAYDSAGDRLFVTGKLWPKLFEIKIVPGR